jgi:pilus assembly protein CpaB
LSPGVNGKVIIDPVLGQAVYVVPSEPQRPRMVSHMLLQDVIVLRVGEFPLEGTDAGPAGAEPTPTPLPDEEAPPGEAPAPVRPDVITLIVSPQDAVTLNYIMMAQSKAAAQLSLVLRRTQDDTRINVLPVTLQFLLEQYQIPVPARLPYSLNPRIDNLTLP